MSFITNQLFSNLLAKQPGSVESDLHSLIFVITSLNNSINHLIDITPKLQVFIKSNNNNLSADVAADTMILRGIPVPLGYRGVVKDFNINFTTAGGSVKVCLIDGNGTVLMDVLRSVSSNSTGTGFPVLEEGQALAIVAQSQGVGVLNAYCSGDLQKVS